ncbi:MAG: hypothetical protein AB1453_11515 [Chloroflexota bacterium]
MSFIQPFAGLIFFAVCLLIYLVAQRKLHHEIQAVFLLLTRSPALALGLFSVIFFPGVLVHELSHLLTAKLLRVKTGRFSLVPQLQPDGSLRLGYVEAEASDPLRETLIGAAPFISGVVLVGWISVSKMGLQGIDADILNQSWSGIWQGLSGWVQQPDFWLWFYLAFTISSTMLPSASDRRAWLPVGLVLGVITFILILAGGGDWMIAYLAVPVNRGLMALAFIFAFSILLHGCLWLPFWLLRRLLSKITGMRVI